MTESELRNRWQAASAETPVLSLQYVRNRVSSLEHRARARNRAEYSIFIVSCFMMSYAIFRLDSVPLQVSIALALAGGLYSMWKWRQVAHISALSDVTSVGDGLAAYRAELERQHAARYNNWRWYLLPSMPGTVMMLVFAFLEKPQKVGMFATCGVLAALWIVFVIAGNSRAAASLQREIDALDSLRGPA